MMIKIVGAALTIFAAAGLGIYGADRWKERLELLETIKKMVIMLKGEILYANSPLSEAFSHVGGRVSGRLGALFSDVSRRMEEQSGEIFYTIWAEEVERLEKDLPLTGKDREGLKSFGEHLGYLDCDMQERTILLYLEQLEDTIGYLREHVREKCRLYTSLGVMAGLFLTIILI